MDPNIQRHLNDKLYDKRKVGALEYVHFLVHPISLTESNPLGGRPWYSSLGIAS
jgi:hypothetical protein